MAVPPPPNRRQSALVPSRALASHRGVTEAGVLFEPGRSAESRPTLDSYSVSHRLTCLLDLDPGPGVLGRAWEVPTLVQPGVI